MLDNWIFKIKKKKKKKKKTLFELAITPQVKSYFRLANLIKTLAVHLELIAYFSYTFYTIEIQFC